MTRLTVLRSWLDGDSLRNIGMDEYLTGKLSSLKKDKYRSVADLCGATVDELIKSGLELDVIVELETFLESFGLYLGLRPTLAEVNAIKAEHLLFTHKPEPDPANET